MAPLVTPPRLVSKLRADDVFFSGMAIILLLVVYAGFARTYFLAGLFRAPLPNWLIHVHATVFTLWIVLFVVQTGFVTTRRVQIHRRIGLLGFALAVLMIALGTLAASDRLARHVGEPGKSTAEEAQVTLNFASYRWQQHCRGLYQTPIAA